MSRSTRSIALASLAVGFLASIGLVSCAGSSDGASGSDGSAAKESTTTTIATAAPAGETAAGPAVPSSGCEATQTALTKEKQFVGDTDRWYFISTPEDLDPESPLPLVMDFHGLAEGAEVHTQMSNLGTYGQENGFIVVTPQGEGTPVRWESDPNLETNPDLQYTTAMLDQLEAEQCIDTSRVYSTGLSNGAFMSSILACTMADRVAAIAPVAGLIRPDDCDPSRPVPVLAFHGTEDPILLFNGGVGDKLDQILGSGEVGAPTSAEGAVPDADLTSGGYPDNAQAWATGNGCSGDPTDEDLTETVIARTWDCPPEGEVEFLIIEGGGHTWPGSEFSNMLADIMGPTDMGIVANEVIWSFFQRFQLPES